ncbi:MAG: GntR family transcriptional regulator [Ornithinimicrobium sp.]
MTTRHIDRDSPMPLWAQVRDDITDRIRRGEFDHRFPGEHQLVQEYEVSRHTLREALRSLRSEGVLEGGRGRATQVARPEISQPQGTLYSLFASVSSAGQRQRSVVRQLDIRADPAVARELGLLEAAPLLYLERLRLSDDEPLAHDCVWLPAQVAAPLLEADFTETSLYAQLEQRCGVRLTGGREQVRAVIPSPDERELLQVGDDVAVLHLERVGEADGRPVEFRRTLIRGDRFALDSDLADPDRVTGTTGPFGAAGGKTKMYVHPDIW